METLETLIENLIKELYVECDKLYDKLPVGQIPSFTLITLIKKHLEETLSILKKYEEILNSPADDYTDKINTMKYKRVDVYKAIDSERDYQDAQAADVNRPDMIDELSIGETLSAIDFNLVKAKEQWYYGSKPHQKSLDFLRKIAALCVKAGEAYGMPERAPVEYPSITTNRGTFRILPEIGEVKIDDYFYVDYNRMLSIGAPYKEPEIVKIISTGDGNGYFETDRGTRIKVYCIISKVKPI